MGKDFDISYRAGEMILGGCLAGIFMAVFWMAVGFGIDALSTQMLLFGLGSLHVTAGFWGMSWIVGSVEAIVAATVFGVVKFLKG